MTRDQIDRVEHYKLRAMMAATIANAFTLDDRNGTYNLDTKAEKAVKMADEILNILDIEDK